MVYVNLILNQTSLLATCLMLRGQETTQLDCLENIYKCHRKFEEQTANFVHDTPYLLLNWSKAINSLYCCSYMARNALR